MKTALLFVSFLLPAALLAQQAQPAPQRVGRSPDGSFLLNSGWRVKPAGRQIALDTLPMASVLSRDGKFLLVLNGGYNPPSISVIDAASEKEISRVPVADGWLGLALSPDGRTLWVGGGSTASIFEFGFSKSGELKPSRTFLLVDGKPTARDFIGDVAVSPDGNLLYAADLFHDRILVVDPKLGRVTARFTTGRRPYRILISPGGKTFFVTNWADGTLSQYQTDNGYRMNSVPLGAHPVDMVWSARQPEVAEGGEKPDWDARIFVAAANTNNVYAVGVKGTEVTPIETINVAATPRHPLGMTPSALALSPDQKRLYVVCSNSNAIAVVNLEETRSRVDGYIPTGWYPTAAAVLSGNRLVVLNGRGARSFPNPKGPNPAKRPSPYQKGNEEVEYVGRIQRGSASVIPPFNAAALARYTREVAAASPYRDSLLDAQDIPQGNPIPSREGVATPIQHVIYIIKENRTYDQVLGDIGKGESDPSLVLFGEKVGPNHHKLAREFALFDNFYVNADVSADGHNWSDAAIANDYVEKMWPNSYGGRRKHYDYEGGEPGALPPAGWLWTNAAAKGISMRNYGNFVTNALTAEDGAVQVAAVRDATLEPVTNKFFRSFDLNYPDQKRVDVFLKDLAEFEKTGAMPQLLLMRLPNDHTYGTVPGKLTPLSMFADNDYALGRLVEAVSRSSFWKNTAIFVLEDDAQNGPDHIDSHRSPAFVISPYVRRGAVDSTMYNTAAMLRTIELILGMRPMTQFDAAATPMWRAFSNQPNLAAYEAEKPRIPLTERNSNPAGAEAEARHLDFSEADLNDDDEMNAMLWRAIRHTAPPPPMRSYYGR